MTADPRLADTLEMDPRDVKLTLARECLQRFYTPSCSDYTGALRELCRILGVTVPYGPPLTESERAMLDSDVEVVTKRSSPTPPRAKGPSKYRASASRSRGSWP